MAHKKGAGSTKTVRLNSNRLGVKVYGGAPVVAATLLFGQRGLVFKPGYNVGCGKISFLSVSKDSVVEFQSATRSIKKVK